MTPDRTAQDHDDNIDASAEQQQESADNERRENNAYD